MGGDIGESQLGSERELYKYINHYAVVRKKTSTEDYSSTGEHYICASRLE